MHDRTSVALPSTEIFDYLKKTISEHYDLGELIRAERNDRGYINISYDIEMFKNGNKNHYLLRHYRSATHEDKIRFEHALMEELLARKFHLSPSLITTRHGSTYAKVDELLKGATQDTFLAIFSYLPGEDKYRWDAPLCTDRELEDAAEVFARYHNTIFGWKDFGTWEEPRIIDQVPLMKKQWRAYAQKAGESPFDLYFVEQSDYLLGILQNSRYLPTKSVYDQLPHLAIHGDYHPGNLKFHDGKVVGLFDFDWAKMDTRCFDVGLAITYFCTSWEDTTDGDLILDRVDLFLDSYQEAAKKVSELGPLSSLELKCLPQMIIAGNLCVLDWTIREFYTTRPDPEEYLRYLRHGVKSLRWIEVNWISLTNLVTN